MKIITRLSPLAAVLLLLISTVSTAEEGADIENLLGAPLNVLGGFKVEGDKVAVETVDRNGLSGFRPAGTASFTRSRGGSGGRNYYRNWESNEIKLNVSVSDSEFSLIFERMKDKPLKIEVKVSGGAISFLLTDETNDRHVTFKQDVKGAITVTTGKGSGIKGYSAESFSDFQRKCPDGYRVLVDALKRCTLVKQGSGLESYAEKVGLEAGECLVILANGSRVKGTVDVNEWVLETAYGNLTIPSVEISGMILGQTLAGEDEVSTIRFTVPGVLKFEKLVVTAKLGTLTIPKSDIREIQFPHPVIEKTFELKPGGEWMNTGIVAKKHDKLEIKAESLDDDVRLICKIADDEFKVDSTFSKSIEKEGFVYLRVEAVENAEKTAEKYQVTVILQK